MQSGQESGGDDLVHIEDQHQKTCLGGDLWALKQQDYFTDLALTGSDGRQVKGHLCVVAVASPLVKNHAVDGASGSRVQHRGSGTEEKVVIAVPNFTTMLIEYFVSFAYRGQVSIPSELVGDLYNLADYFMDVALQQAITNTVGSVPANIPNIAQVLTKGEPEKEYDLDEKEEAEWLAAMAKKTPGRRKGRLPKKNHVKKEGLEVIDAVPMETTSEETESSSQANGTSLQMTRIKRKSAVDATAKLKRSTRTVRDDTDGDDANDDTIDDLPDPDDDVHDDDTAATSRTPRRRLLKRKAKTASRRKSARSSISSSQCSKGDADRPELEWVDGKPSTVCKRCERTVCLHRVTFISPEEMEYHVRVEGGLVIDNPLPVTTATAEEEEEGEEGEEGAAGVDNVLADGVYGSSSDNTAVIRGNSADVREGIDALLSMARGGSSGQRPVATDSTEDNVTSTGNDKASNSNAGNDIEMTRNEGKLEPKEEGEDDDVPQPKVPQASPLRTKYKLWVDPVSKKTKKLFPCEHCGNLYLSLARLIRHMPTHTGVFPFLCPLCTASFKTKDELTKHDRRKHRGTASTGFPGAQYQCQQCAVAFHKRHALEKHVSNHSNDTRQPRANYVLKRKPENNRLVRTYPCPHCPAEFNKASEFEGHLSSHTGIKLYHCRLCNKRFGCEGYLKKHMLRHVEEKSYICALCGAAFKTSSGLYTHEHSVHIETKPFVCEVCGKEFKMKWSMKEHLRMAHSDFVLPKDQTSNWQCSYCGGFLPSEVMFKIHEKLHVTDKPFKCRLCSASFKYRAARLSHERREHEGVQQDPRLVMPRTPKKKQESVNSSSAAASSMGSSVRSMDETSPPYIESECYPQQHRALLPPPQSFMQHHQLQHQQQQHQQQQQQQHPPPLPLSSPHHHPHSREVTPNRNLSSGVTSLPIMTTHYSTQSTPSHTPTPAEVAYHARVSTPNTFSHPGPSSTSTELPVYSASHLLPAAPAASLLYDPSYYMAAVAGAAHLPPPSHSLPPPPSSHHAPHPHPPPPPPPPPPTHQSSGSHPIPSPSPVVSQQQPPPPPPPPQSASGANRNTPQPPPHSICSICNLSFENQPQLWNHMALIHNIM